MSGLNRGGDLQVDDIRWRLLHKLSGWAALVAALLFRRNLAEEFLLLRASNKTLFWIHQAFRHTLLAKC
jgi:hypothetical protein